MLARQSGTTNFRVSRGDSYHLHQKDYRSWVCGGWVPRLMRAGLTKAMEPSGDKCMAHQLKGHYLENSLTAKACLLWGNIWSSGSALPPHGLHIIVSIHFTVRVEGSKILVFGLRAGWTDGPWPYFSVVQNGLRESMDLWELMTNFSAYMYIFNLLERGHQNLIRFWNGSKPQKNQLFLFWRVWESHPWLQDSRLQLGLAAHNLVVRED